MQLYLKRANLKKSIVLLITLALIVSLAVSIAVGLHYVQQAQTQITSRQSLLQSFVFAHSIENILARFAQDINGSDELSLLFDLPIDIKSQEVNAHIEFAPVATGLNPNNIVKKVVDKKIIFDANYILLLDKILQDANVLNKELFLAILEDSFDGDYEERIPGSEIGLYNKRFAQGRIESFQKFSLLVDRYVLLTKDENIYKIPWKEILSFNSQTIDFNYISPKLLYYMLPFSDNETVARLTTQKSDVFQGWSDLHLSQEIVKELKKYHISFFVPIVEVRLSGSAIEGVTQIVYDIKKKKVIDIAFKQ